MADARLYRSKLSLFGSLALSTQLASAQPDQADPPSAAQNAATPAAGATSSAQTQGQDDTSVEAKPEWRVAMTHYELGQPEQALEMLRAQAFACESGSKTCDVSEVAAIYSCVGIVMAGAKGDHAAGVVAFKKALSVQPGTTLAPEYAIPQVVAAYNEAAGITAPAPASAIPLDDSGDGYESSLPPADESDDDEDEPEPPPDPNRAKMILLIGGGAKVGPYFVTHNDTYLLDEWGDSDSVAALQLGGSAAFGYAPSASGFTFGARVRGGVLRRLEELNIDELERYAGNSDAWMAYFGAHALLGVTMGPRKDGRFSYVYVGPGFEITPEGGPPWFTLNAMGGTSLGGLTLGGGIDFGMREHGNYLVNYVLLGVEVGFGAGF